MKLKLALNVVAVVFFVSVVLPQNQSFAPKPGPELKKLEYFTGNWKTDAEMKPSQYIPGGKFTATDHGEWLAGDFFVVTHSDYTSPLGKGVQLSVLGYDAAEKVYTFNSYSGAGVHTSASGTLDGDTWTFVSNDKMGGQTIGSRHIIKILSQNEYSFRFEMSYDGATWSPVIEGKATRVQ